MSPTALFQEIIQKEKDYYNDLNTIREMLKAGEIRIHDAISAVLGRTEMLLKSDTMRMTGLDRVKGMVLLDYKDGIKVRNISPKVGVFEAAKALSAAYALYFRGSPEAENRYPEIQALYIAAYETGIASPDDVAEALAETADTLLPEKKCTAHGDAEHPLRVGAKEIIKTLRSLDHSNVCLVPVQAEVTQYALQ